MVFEEKYNFIFQFSIFLIFNFSLTIYSEIFATNEITFAEPKTGTYVSYHVRNRKQHAAIFDNDRAQHVFQFFR